MAGWWRWLRWQASSRLAPGPIVIPLTDEAFLLASPSMHGATTNYYTGLSECDDMAFRLHFLRPDDFFLDVGANGGAYSVLAGAVVGCTGLAFEPDARSHDRLRLNLALNRIGERIEVARRVVGRGAAL